MRAEMSPASRPFGILGIRGTMRILSGYLLLTWFEVSRPKGERSRI